jgi:hypothetical protein
MFGMFINIWVLLVAGVGSLYRSLGVLKIIYISILASEKLGYR